MNILSIDFEDWHQLIQRRVTGHVELANTKALERQMDVLLSLLAETNTNATFFILGMAAEQNPALVKRIAAAGHELACHGYAHLQVFRLTRDQFIEDTKRGKRLIEDLTGERVLGYRAAEFSINRDSLWALATLAELGFSFDSSIFPVRHRRYGIPGFRKTPARYLLPGEHQIAELPLAAFRWLGIQWPVAGGGYFRLMPAGMLRSIVQRIENSGEVMNCYLHPYEFDTKELRIFANGNAPSLRSKMRAAFLNMHQNLGREGIPRKLRALLTGFRFGTCSQYLRETKLDECRELLSDAR
jgi:polysaccharide deacetylase family protein (PEP-CTERM system associated)